MSGEVWIALLIVGIPAILTACGGAISWAITLLLARSQEAIEELEDERDYWKDEALRCREEQRELRFDA